MRLSSHRAVLRMRSLSLLPPIALIVCTVAAGARPLGAQSTATRAPSARAITGHLLVANQQAQSATIVNLATGVSTHVTVGDGPHEAAISPDGRTGVITVYGTSTPGNRLAIIDLASAKVLRHVDLGTYTRPHGAHFLPGSNTMLAVTSEATQRIVLVDLRRDSVVAAIPTESAGSHMLGITSNGQRLYTANVGSGSVTEIDLAARIHQRSLPVAARTEGIAVRPDGAEVWIGSNTTGEVSVVDTRTWTITATVKGFSMPYRIGISPDNRLAVVVDPQNDNIGVVDIATRAILGVIGGLASPRGVYIGDDNRTAFITSAGKSAVVEVDLIDRVIRGEYAVQQAPDGVAFSARR